MQSSNSDVASPFLLRLSPTHHLFVLLALPPSSRLSTPPKLAAVDFVARSISSSPPLFLRRAALPQSLSDPSPPLSSSVLWLAPSSRKTIRGDSQGKKCPSLCPRFRARSFDHSFIQPSVRCCWCAIEGTGCGGWMGIPLQSPIQYQQFEVPAARK